MGNVIPFDEGKRKRGNKSNSDNKKSKIVTEKITTECPAVLNLLKEGSRTDVDYADMEPEKKIEYWKNIEKEEEERFQCKYSDVLAAMPVSAGEKMQYFAKVMLYLLSDIFHSSNWDIRFDTWLDFCEFYMSGFDSAYSDYIKENKEFEKEYQYKFRAMAAEELEEELVDCLEKIVEKCPEKKEDDKTAMMYQAAKLFELQELLSDLFYMEVTKD